MGSLTGFFWICQQAYRGMLLYDRFYPMRSKDGDKNLISPATFAGWENAE